MAEMSEENLEKYRRAGQAVADALRVGQEIARPGVPFLEVCTKTERVIRDHGVDLAFPTNASLDDVAAHYSSPIGDKTVLPDHGLLKIDCGAHCDGFIADAARTVNLGTDEGIHVTLAEAAKAALDKAIENFQPGVPLYRIGEIINDTITAYGVKPISNLGGHQLRQYQLHGEYVPNVLEPKCSYEIQVGDAFAIEPFSTEGQGSVKNGREAYIYRYVKGFPKKKKGIKQKDKRQLASFKSRFSSLPFSPRWIDFIETDHIPQTLEDYLRAGVLENYKILVERGKGLVAQWEDTVVVHEDGPEVTTR